MPVPGRLRRLTDQYEVLSRCTNSLAAVIELMSITFKLIKQSIAEHQAATVGASPLQLPLPAPAEPRTGTPTLEEREEGAEVQLPLPSPAESMTGTPTYTGGEGRKGRSATAPPIPRGIDAYTGGEGDSCRGNFREVQVYGGSSSKN